ncbi:MAG: single-stranded DNA-binding protein [Lachnospiraceae bacterium]|jgi:single-strand DNA-binding protein|nr:single-stranded DNA-binding protein [Lachnospiraceae bacterium]
MNKVILMGRLTRDPEVRYGSGENQLAIANYSIAVDRRFRRDSEDSTDFFNCVAFGKAAEHAEKYYHKGIKIVICGRLQSRSYTNKDGIKVNVVEIVVEEQEFAESKSASEKSSGGYQQNTSSSSNDLADGFMNIPDGIDEELPFN